MYNIIMCVMQIGVRIAAFFDSKVRKMWRGEQASFDVLREHVEASAHYIWFHAASLGEFEQGRPLMEAIRRDYPEYKILLTFFSPSGYEVRKNYQGADIITYLPIDTISNARRFLRLVRPVMAFFVKYEFWYNYLHILRHREVPVYSVSSIFRPGQIFFRPYGRQYGRVLRCFTRFFVQNEESRRLLYSIGIKQVDVVGDTRFDRVLQVKQERKRLPLIEQFVGTSHRVFVAGSSWLPDEELFLRYFSSHPEWKLIIAPHVIEEEHLAQIRQLLQGKKVVRYTQSDQVAVADADVLLIDCFGLLSSVYHYGQVAYVGGGFGVGIHNVLEAAVWGMPVIFGPNNKHFQEAQGLIAAQGGFEVSDDAGFAQLMNRFAEDEDYLQKSAHCAADFVQNLTGATEKVLNTVRPELEKLRQGQI